MCQVGECKTKFRKFSFTLSIWRDGFLAAVSFSPTPMDRWRIKALGKPVLSLPINDPFGITIIQAEGTHWSRVRERNRFLFCARFLQYVAGKEQQWQRCLESNSGCQWNKVLRICCIYSTTYLMLINWRLQIHKSLHWYQSPSFKPSFDRMQSGSAPLICVDEWLFCCVERCLYCCIEACDGRFF